ncbi:MAG: hypothetical protein OEZ23_04795 [Gammaproteobacteria bacterium]|nr:hypothetical protein [Gammaproteobacteria bacterium]
MTDNPDTARATTPTDNQSLQRLLDYIEEECSRRCSEILTEAKDEARQLLGKTRSDGRRRVHQAFTEQKRQHARDCERVHAENHSRIRRSWFRLIRKALDEAWPALHQALVNHWQASAANRCAWLAATLETATHALGPGLWHIEHPLDWQQNEGDGLIEALRREYAVLDIRFLPSNHVAGFRVICSDVSVSTTIEGLLSSPSRIEGLWLGLLQDEKVLNMPSINSERGYPDASTG